MSTTTKPQTFDLQPVAMDVLKTVLLLDKPFGINYSLRILRGENAFDWKDPQHKALETFGAQSTYGKTKLYQMVIYLINQGFLALKDVRFGSISITEKGKAFLDNPHPLEVAFNLFKTDIFDRVLMDRLRTFRKEISEQEEKPPYEIFTDYVLHCMVSEKPEDLLGLKKLPGLGNYKVERYGYALLNIIKEIKSERADEARGRLMAKALAPSSQEIKKAFESGLSLEAIARQREVKPQTVQQTLVTLHQAGEIDIRPWIETHVEKESLQKGKTFFETHDNPRLTEAYEALGLDYDTLRLCRLYVNKVASVQEEIQYVLEDNT